MPTAMPSKEAVLVSGLLSEALTLRIEARRGQRLVVELEPLQSGDASIFEADPSFVDVFADGAGGDGRSGAPLASGTSVEPMRCEIPSDGAYLVRLQPPLGTVLRAVVHARLEPSMAFPVADKDPRAVASTFGAPREGGRRQHHGVDIFAPRGTKVLAAAAGTVLRVGTNRLGGNVVWMRSDDPPLVLYYAHLDRVHVSDGQRLEAGAIVGDVGNTGNARSTAPHLHFGIYGRGPVDPHPFVARGRGRAPALRVPSEHLGRWLRVPSAGTHLREGPQPSSPVVASLPRDTPVLLKGARGASVRVELADGRVGWLPANRVRPWPKRRFSKSSEHGIPLLAVPKADAPVLVALDEAAVFVERAVWEGYRLVETRAGDLGWIAPPRLDGV
mgnify:CR=1 FL=1